MLRHGGGVEAPIGAGSSRDWTGLVDRDREREQIVGALIGSEHGRGRFVVLYGTAGVGRSSLLHASALDAEARGIDVLEACGDELERGYGFGIVRQLLEARLASLAGDRRRSLLTAAGPHADSALGLGSSRAGVSGASFDQIEALSRLITHLAAEKPLLIAVDDLQWSDRPSLDLLCFLGHRATRLPVTIVAAWRRGEPGVSAGRLQALAGKPDTLFLSPAPLSLEGVRSVLELETGSTPDGEAVAVIHAQTGGQPFLVTELVRGLVLRDLPAKTGCREAIEAVTPEAVRRNVVARLGRHSQHVRRFAHAVAVLGDASLAQAAALATIDQSKARAAADALVRAGILRDHSTLVYAQPLLRAAVHDTLTSLESGELHQRAAALLYDAGQGSDPTDLELIAEHLLHSDPAGDQRFAEALRTVASRAAAAGAFDDAQRMLQRALGEIDNAADRGDVLTRLSELELRAGHPTAAAAHATEALTLASTPTERMVATLACSQAVAATMNCAAAAELVEAEAEHLGEIDADLEFTLRAAGAVLRVCAQAAPSVSQDTIAGFENLAGDTPRERAMLAGFASHAVLTGAASGGRVSNACARTLADRGQAPWGGFSAIADYLACRAALLADAGELVDPLLGRVSEDDHTTLCRLGLRAQLALARGRLAEATTDARTALAVLDQLPPIALNCRMRSDLLVVLAAVAIERSDHAEVEQLLSVLPDADDAPTTATACLRLALGLAQSMPALEIALAAEEEPIGLAAPGLSWRPLAALTHHAAGDGTRALALASTHLRHADAWGIPSVLGRALVVRGVVDPGSERLRFIEDGVAVLEHTQATLELARATIEFGIALRRARRRRESRDQLVRGADLAHRCGAEVLAELARAQLVSAGARPRRAAFSGVASLTVSELRVARLAAAGMTNRAIALELIVSAKTVSGQLAAAYRKLDVHDRAALAIELQQADHSERVSPERAAEPVH